MADRPLLPVAQWHECKRIGPSQQVVASQPLSSAFKNLSNALASDFLLSVFHEHPFNVAATASRLSKPSTPFDELGKSGGRSERLFFQDFKALITRRAFPSGRSVLDANPGALPTGS
jgi:hypothetical protein